MSCNDWESYLRDRVIAAQRAHQACGGRDPAVCRELERALSLFCDYIYEHEELPDPELETCRQR
jgi:hypothetical protein